MHDGDGVLGGDQKVWGGWWYATEKTRANPDREIYYNNAYSSQPASYDTISSGESATPFARCTAFFWQVSSEEAANGTTEGAVRVTT
jgi:hypothetical protein